MTLRGRVKRGVEKIPRILKTHIDWKTLDMGSEEHHILAQVYGSLASGMVTADIQDLAAYGMVKEPGVEEMWRDEVARRVRAILLVQLQDPADATAFLLFNMKKAQDEKLPEEEVRHVYEQALLLMVEAYVKRQKEH